MKTGLAFISGESPQILILGSLPGDKSIKEQQYYAHPQNHFWAIMSRLLHTPMPEGYEKRIEILKKNNIALWDVLHSAERAGSLDSKIKSPVPNDLYEFIKGRPSIKLVVLNGKKAAECYAKYFSDIAIPSVCVRSSSPVASQSCNTPHEKATQWAAEIGKYTNI